jgi:nucleolar pre-ribosomal-associated protein 1
LFYRGSLALADRKLLGLFQLFEVQRKISVASVLCYWSANGASVRRSLDALLSLDPGKVMATCCAFPLHRSLANHGKASEHEGGKDVAEGLYDPSFVLPLLGATLVEGDVRGLDWVEILRSNVLGLAACALASRDHGMRMMGGWVLSMSIAAIEVS